MEKIGRYVIESEIGRGAMGVVYLAHDPRLRRRVAVKTYSLPEGLSEEQLREFQVRFLREAQAAASLSHPGIVVIYDVDADPELGLPFIAMEYIHGRSLKELLAEGGRVSPRWTFKMGTVLADALRVAHETGIIHRDIKPANILLRVPDGAAKIADFGVARLSTSDLTRSSAALGSPAYMSPEQFRGSALDGRSDLFSLATVLYEAFTGSRPFAGEDIPSLAYAIAHERVEPVTKRIRDLPSGLNDFFERALAKDPGDRFPDGAAFLAALEEARMTDPAAAADRAQAAEAQDPDSNTVPEENPESSDSEAEQPLVHKRRGRFLAVKLAASAILSLSLLGGAVFWILRPAHLMLDGKSSIEAGRLSLLVDGHEVYSRQLSAPRQGNRMVGKLLGRDQESFQDWIKISPGRHEVAARVLAEGVGPDFRDSIVVELKAGETRTLRMNAGRSFGSPVSLKLD